MTEPDTVLIPTTLHSSLLTLPPSSTTDLSTVPDLSTFPPLELQLSGISNQSLEKRKSSSRRAKALALALSQSQDSQESHISKVRHRSRSGRFITAATAADVVPPVSQTDGVSPVSSGNQQTPPQINFFTLQPTFSMLQPMFIDQKESSPNDPASTSSSPSQQLSAGTPPSSVNTTPSMLAAIPPQEPEDLPPVKRVSRMKSRIVKPDIEPLTGGSGSDTEVEDGYDDEDDSSEDADNGESDEDVPNHSSGNPCRNNGVKLRDLIDAGLIKPPLQIFFKYHETEHKATIIETGEIEVTSRLFCWTYPRKGGRKAFCYSNCMDQEIYRQCCETKTYNHGRRKTVVSY